LRQIVSILSAGTFFGALTAAPVADAIGRRFGLIASNGVFCLGVILQMAAQTIPTFVAGRFFAGYGVGMISAMSKQNSGVLARAVGSNLWQFLCINQRLRQSGSEAPSWARTNLP